MCIYYISLIYLIDGLKPAVGKRLNFAQARYFSRTTLGRKLLWTKQ